MEERADAFLALPGGIGTLEELFEVWMARSLGMHSKPVVALDVDGLCAPLRLQIAAMADRGFIRAPVVGALPWANSVEQALDLCEQGIRTATRLEPLAEDELEADLQVRGAASPTTSH